MPSSLKETMELAAKLVEHIVGYLEFFVNSVNSNIFISVIYLGVELFAQKLS